VGGDLRTGAAMKVSPLAGTPATQEMLIDVARAID
jgi:hypothetical protein